MIEKKKNDETYERKEIIKERMLHRGLQLYFVLIMKSHLQSYPCPLEINSHGKNVVIINPSLEES